MTTFADLGLSAPVLKALEDVGYEQPSPIQEQAIPILDLGDRFGLAQPALESAAFVVAVIVASGRLVMVPVSKLLGRD